MDRTSDGREQACPERCLKVRVIDDGLRLVTYYPDEEVTLGWYRDPEVVKQVDNGDCLYTPERLKEMYAFLSENGDCYYAEYRGELAGDVTLRDNGEICIVIAKEYQNRHIGRRCIREMIALVNEDQRRMLEEDCGMQFSHTLGEQLGGQMKAGFILTDLYDDTNGSGYLHELNIKAYVATRAVKPV